MQGTEEPTTEFLTEEAAANLIDQEVQAALGKFDLQQHIDDYLETMPSSQLDLTAIGLGFKDLLADLNLEFAQANQLPKIERHKFVALIDEHTDLTKFDS